MLVRSQILGDYPFKRVMVGLPDGREGKVPLLPPAHLVVEALAKQTFHLNTQIMKQNLHEKWCILAFKGTEA